MSGSLTDNSPKALIPKLSGRPTNDDATEFFDALWENASPKCTENMIMRAGWKQISKSLSSMRDDKSGSYVNGVFRFSEKMWQEDVFYSSNTFKPTGSFQCDNTIANMFAVYSFAIDVDYKKELAAAESIGLQYKLGIDSQSGITVYNGNPDGFYMMISEDFELLKIPVPSYIEYGHQLRLIYLLASPVNMTMSYSVKAERAITKLQNYICRRLNAAFGCGAERQLISGYYRFPGSVNTKDGSTVCIKKISGSKYVLSELMEEYLPDLPQFPKNNPAKARKHQVNKSKENHYCSPSLCVARLSCFENLRQYASENHLRELLTFLYVATFLTIDSEKDPVELASAFNGGFPNPLPENEIRWRFRQTHDYRFKNETIAEMLGLTVEELQNQYGLPYNKRVRSKAEKEARGETRRQKADRNYDAYKRLANEGMRQKDIAKELDLSINTIKKYSVRRNAEKETI